MSVVRNGRTTTERGTQVECSIYYYEDLLDDEPIGLHDIDYACSETCMYRGLDSLGVPGPVQVARINEAHGATINGNVLSWGRTPCADHGDSATYCVGCGVMLSRDYEDNAECHSTPFIVGRVDIYAREECETCGVVLKVPAFVGPR